MKEKDSIGDTACQSLAVLTQFDDPSFLLSSQTDCLVHPMVKQIIFMNVLAQIKPLLINNGESNACSRSVRRNAIMHRFLLFGNDRGKG
jgi:hypothetical protein